MGTEALQIQTGNNEPFLANRPNILLIEDDLCLQVVHSLYLQKAKYNFHIAATGRDAILAFNSHHFDLVLLDIQLPDMSGIDVNKVIRSSSRGKTVPVIALSSLGKTIEKECLDAGVNQVFDKPIKYDDFLNVLKTTLGV